MATEKPNLLEIATTANGRDITRGYVDGLSTLTPQDPVLQQHGYDYQVYERLMQDDQVNACFSQRRLAVVARPWSVTPGGKKRRDKQAAELIEATLKNFDFDTITDQMLYARLFGFAVAELIWDIAAGDVLLKDIRVRNQRRFAFGPDNSLRLLTLSKPDGEEVPDKAFWHISIGAHYHDEPYGRGLGSALYWPVYFKRNGARFWATFLEKFGSPTALGHFPMGSSGAERNKLLASLQAIATDAGIIIPEGMNVELIEATRGGSGGYDVWMSYWDDAIAKIVLGQTMTTQDGSSLSQAQVHYAVRQEIIQADADLVCQSANNTWVKWLIDYNLPGAAYPQIWRDMEESEDLANRSQRDQTLFGMGYKLTPDAVTKIYGPDYEVIAPTTDAPAKDEASPLKKPIGFSLDFAQSPADDYLNPVPLMTETLLSETAPDWDAVLAYIQRLVDAAPDLPSLRDSLLDAFQNLPETLLPEIMEQAFMAANLTGRYDVEAESYG